MSGVNKFSGEGQAKNHHAVPYYWPIYEEKVSPSEKVTPSEEVEKGTNTLDDMEEPVFTIRRKYLDNFHGQYTVSTGWFNLDHEWLKGKFSTLKPDFYKNFLK